MLKTKYTKPLSEFAIIDRFFRPLSQIKNRFSSLSNQSPDLIGDDGAVLKYSDKPAKEPTIKPTVRPTTGSCQ